MTLDVREHEGRLYVHGVCSIPESESYAYDGYDEEAVLCLKCHASGDWYCDVKHDKNCKPKRTRKTKKRSK